MKNFLIKFKSIIQFIVSIIASREFAFVYCVFGTIAQTAHTYYLLDGISSLNGWWKITQSCLLAFFISSSLLYFTAISDSNDKTPAGKRVLNAVTLFMWLEIVINLYYYSRHIIIDAKTIDYYQLGFGVLIACIIPVTIKLYSSQIRAKEWLDLDDVVSNSSNIAIDASRIKLEIINELKEEFLTDIENKLSSVNTSDFNFNLDEELDKLRLEFENKLNEHELGKNPKEYVDAIINEKISELDSKIGSVDTKISAAFQKNSDLFLKQFQNKLEMMTKK